MRPINVLELRSVRGTGGGPEKTILHGAAGSDPSRFRVTVCYLRPETDPLFEIHSRAAALGVDYVEFRERHALDTSIWTKLRDLVRARGIHVVHAHDYKTDLLALALANAEGIVPLATAHGWTGHTAVERFVYYPADKLLLGRFPAVVAVSGEIRAELQKWRCDASRVHVVLNGIDHRAFVRNRALEAASRSTLGLLPEDIVLGSVGRLEPQKRFDLLIEAFARLRPAHPRARLLIAGEGGSRPALEALIGQRGLTESCRLIGHCTDIRAFHHSLDLFVQSSEYEGTPNVVLEAMALESPIVATSVGGTAELVRDGIDGLLVPSGAVDDLAAAMNAALSAPEATRTRRCAARRRIEHELSFDNRMAALESIYERICDTSQYSRNRKSTLAADFRR